MKHLRVNPDAIGIPETRVTAQFDEETWTQFQSSIKEMGAIAPIICCQVDDQIVLVDGLHRLVEARKAGQKFVDIVIIPGDMVDVLTKNIFLDHLRGKTPVSEMVKVIEVLWKEYQLDSEKIVEKTGMTRDYVEKLQKISELTPYCRQALDEGRIGVGLAFALTRLKDPVDQEMALGHVELYHWKAKELNEWIDMVEATKAQKEAEPAPPGERPRAKVKCFYCREEKDITELANPPICRECSGFMLAAIAQERRIAAAEAAVQSKEAEKTA